MLRGRGCDLVMQDKDMVAIRWLALPTLIGKFKEKRLYDVKDAESLAYRLRELADKIDNTVADIKADVRHGVVGMSFEDYKAGFKGAGENEG